VRLGEVSGAVLAKALDNLTTTGQERPDGPLRPYKRIYIQSHIRTRQWFKNGTAFKWKDGQDNSTVAYSPMKTTRAWKIMEEHGQHG